MDTYGFVTPGLDVDLDQVYTALRSKSADTKQRTPTTVVAPLWIGLTLSKKDAAVEKNRSSTMNRHGGSSTALSKNRHHRRNAAAPLVKYNQGKKNTCESSQTLLKQFVPKELLAPGLRPSRAEFFQCMSSSSYWVVGPIR